MSRKATTFQLPNYLRGSTKFNYKPYRRPKTLQNNIRSLKHLLFEEEEFQEQSEEDYSEEQSEEDYSEEQSDEESEKEFKEKSEGEFTEEQDYEEQGSDRQSEEDYSEEQSEEDDSEEQSEEDVSEEQSEKDVSEEQSEDNHFEEQSGEESEEDFEEQSEEEELEEQSKEDQFREEKELEDESEEKSADESEEDHYEDRSEEQERSKEEFREEQSEEESEEEEELKMALVNARSLNKFINRRDTPLIELIQNNDLDVLLITETWLPTENLTMGDLRSILPRKYNIIDEPRSYGRGGGVAIIHHKTLICKQIQFDFPSTFEFVAAAVRQPGSRETVLILSIYRPPGGSVTEFSSDFLSELHLLLSDVYARYENVVIGGDFNIWFDCPGMTVTQEFEEFMRENSLVQHVWRPTHEGGHVLDLVLSSPSVKVSNVSVRDNEFSDHRTILFRARF